MPEDEPDIDDESFLYRVFEPKGQYHSGHGENGIGQQSQKDNRIEQGKGAAAPLSQEEISGSVEHDP